MPPRSIIIAIVVFWAAAMSWLFYRDVWPDLRPGDRPPFTVDISNEAVGYRDTDPRANTRWTLHHNGQRIGYAHTATTFDRREELYVLSNRIIMEKEKDNERERLRYAVAGVELEIDKMSSFYRVTRSGELRTVDARLTLSVSSKQFATETVEILVQGEVEEGVFTPHWRADSILLGRQELKGEPIEVPSHNSMLNPMQPWNRIYNVRKGQQWRMALFDPLSDSMASIVPGRKPTVRTLDAGVLETTDELNWEQKLVSCLVIEYHDRPNRMTARTWVRESDGLVLKQEAVRDEGTLRPDRLALERMPQ